MRGSALRQEQEVFQLEVKLPPASDLSPMNVARSILTPPVFARTDLLFSTFGLSPLQRELGLSLATMELKERMPHEVFLPEI